MGIIGVAASLTIPSLIQSYKKQVVETRLKKIYSVMNQAIVLSEVDNGNREWWYENLKGPQIDDDGNVIEGSSQAEKWFKKYLAPYLKYTEIKAGKNGGLLIYFPDGSILAITSHTSRDWVYYVTGEKCLKNTRYGVCGFLFNFYPTYKYTSTVPQNWRYFTRNFEPFVYAWDGTKESLYENCSSNTCHEFCARLIMLNGWKIPKDYPLKF